MPVLHTPDDDDDEDEDELGEGVVLSAPAEVDGRSIFLGLSVDSLSTVGAVLI